MKKILLSLMVLASMLTSNVFANGFYGDPESPIYMYWEYQKEPQALNMIFPNADQVIYNGFVQINIYQGTSLQDKHVVATGQESQVTENTFTCIFDQPLPEGDYFIQARTDVFTVIGVENTPAEYLKLDFHVDGGGTQLSGVSAVTADGQVFDLMGRPSNNANGIRIMNGKKMIIR